MTFYCVWTYTVISVSYTHLSNNGLLCWTRLPCSGYDSCNANTFLTSILVLQVFSYTLFITLFVRWQNDPHIRVSNQKKHKCKFWIKHHIKSARARVFVLFMFCVWIRLSTAFDIFPDCFFCAVEKSRGDVLLRRADKIVFVRNRILWTLTGLMLHFWPWLFICRDVYRRGKINGQRTELIQ